MGEWKSVSLSEVVKLLKDTYPDDTFIVGIDRDNMIYYVVPDSLGLDASIAEIENSLKPEKVRDSIGHEGFPRDVYIWLEEDEDDGLLDEEDLKELSKELDIQPPPDTEKKEEQKTDQADSEIDRLKQRVQELEHQLEENGGGDEDMDYLVAELDKLREENRELEKTLSEKGGAGIPESESDKGESPEVEIIKGGSDEESRAFMQKELVDADTGAEIAQTTRKEFDKLVEKGEISPFRDNLFKTSDLLRFALSLYEEGTVPVRKYNLDVEAAREELPDSHGEGKCVPVSEGGADSSYTSFFGDELYDRAFAENAVESINEIGIAPEGFNIDSLEGVSDGKGEEQYRIPAPIVILVEKFEEISALIQKARELQNRIEDQSEKAENLDRKITNFREEEEKITEEISRDREELKKLDTVLGEIEKSGLGKLRERLSNLFDNR